MSLRFCLCVLVFVFESNYTFGLPSQGTPAEQTEAIFGVSCCINPVFGAVAQGLGLQLAVGVSWRFSCQGCQGLSVRRLLVAFVCVFVRKCVCLFVCVCVCLCVGWWVGWWVGWRAGGWLGGWVCFCVFMRLCHVFMQATLLSAELQSGSDGHGL